MNFKKYTKKTVTEIRPYIRGETFYMGCEWHPNTSISEELKKAGHPELGDMICRDPNNHDDQWLITEKYFTENYIQGRINMPDHFVDVNKMVGKRGNRVKQIKFRLIRGRWSEDSKQSYVVLRSTVGVVELQPGGDDCKYFFDAWKPCKEFFANNNDDAIKQYQEEIALQSLASDSMSWEVIQEDERSFSVNIMSNDADN